MRSEVLDALQHLGHEGRARTDEGRAHRAGAHTDRRVVGAEATRRERIVGELVAVALLGAAVHEQRVLVVLDVARVAQRLDELRQVVPVDRADVVEAEALEEGRKRR